MACTHTAEIQAELSELRAPSSTLRSPYISQELDETAIGMSRPEELAESLFMASCVCGLGLDTAVQRVTHDVPLLTRKTMQILVDLGYEPDLEIAIEALELMLLRKIPIESDHQFYARTVEVNGEKKKLQICLLPEEGRSMWGVAISAFGDEAMGDLTSAVQLAREKLEYSVRYTAAQLEVSGNRPEVNTMGYAILRSSKSFVMAYSFASFDPVFIKDFINTMLTPENLRGFVVGETAGV